MIKEYRSIQEVAGPLMLVTGVEGVKYDELGEIELSSGETRRCKVLEVNGDSALVQLFESSTGINLSNRGPVFPITSTDVAITPILPLKADGHAYVFPFDSELRISADRPFIVDVDGVRDKTERYAIDIKRAPKMIRRIR